MRNAVSMCTCEHLWCWSLVFAPLIDLLHNCKQEPTTSFTQQAQKIKVDDLVDRPQTFYISAAYVQQANKLQLAAIILQVQEAAWESR